MSEVVEILIPDDEQAKEFSDHLAIKGNSQILFSGRFGSGKTTFLKKFFSKRQEEYKVLHLSPVNYSVANNKDIFELIKFDILYELIIDYRCHPETEDFPEPLKTQMFFLSNNFQDELISILKKIIGSASDIGKYSVEAIEIISKLFDSLKKHQKELTETDLDKSKEYLENFTNLIGGIYEQDIYTQLIRTFVNKLQRQNLKVTLIIDDLDRLDPEHIFRILNIFSVHGDLMPSQRINKNQQPLNKFDLDLVIAVCDIENLRKIYASKYGQETHFSGYIDKFYSKYIYYFSISKYALAFAKDILKKIEAINAPYNPYFHGEKIFINQVLCTHFDSFSLLFLSQISAGFISIRELSKLKDLQFNFPSEKTDRGKVPKIEQIAWVYIELLRIIFDRDHKEIETVLYRSKHKSFEFEEISIRDLNNYLLGNYIYLRKRDNKFFKNRNNPVAKDTIEWNDVKLEINLNYIEDENSGFPKFYFSTKIDKVIDSNPESKNIVLSELDSRSYLETLNPFEILEKCFEEYEKFGAH